MRYTEVVDSYGGVALAGRRRHETFRDRGVGKGFSKYDPLRSYLLSHQRRPEILMALEEIERILGFKLCESARYPWWWANTSSDLGHSQRRIWGDAGFDAFLAPTRDTVSFIRTDAPSYPALERRAGGRARTKGER